MKKIKRISNIANRLENKTKEILDLDEEDQFKKDLEEENDVYFCELKPK
jgi:hypothetical protein